MGHKKKKYIDILVLVSYRDEFWPETILCKYVTLRHKIFYGTTEANGNATFNHGLDNTKIISVTGSYINAGDVGFSLQFTYYAGATSISCINIHPFASSLSPYKIIITYKA